MILSGSRTGSSYLKSILAYSPDLTALDGEEETYVQYCGNGYNADGKSDEFDVLRNPALFRSLIHRELTTNDPWGHRLPFQFAGRKLADMLNDPDRDHLHEYLGRHGVLGHYDISPRDRRRAFHTMVYEMPPFVVPKRRDREPGGTLLLKSPYNLLRAGMMEAVWPDAQFSYVILKRHPARVMNGLIDGWESPYGFHKYHIPGVGWWKFDLPEGAHTDPMSTTIPERAFLQWKTSARLTLHHQTDATGVIVDFDGLIRKPELVIRSVCSLLDIRPPTAFPTDVVMASEPPDPDRWLKRKTLIKGLLLREPELVRELMYGEVSSW